MAQMNIYLLDQLAKIIRKCADTAGLSVSKYLSRQFAMKLGDRWPPGYAESVFGKWHGEPLTRVREGNFETRRFDYHSRV